MSTPAAPTEPETVYATQPIFTPTTSTLDGASASDGGEPSALDTSSSATSGVIAGLGATGIIVISVILYFVFKKR